MGSSPGLGSRGAKSDGSRALRVISALMGSLERSLSVSGNPGVLDPSAVLDPKNVYVGTSNAAALPLIAPN